MCLNPIPMPNRAYQNAVGGNHLLATISGDDSFLDRPLESTPGHTIPEYIFVDCRRCAECISRRNKSARDRMLLDFALIKKHYEFLFVTLTYDEQHLPVRNFTNTVDDTLHDIVSGHLREFFEGIRHHYGKSVRHFVCSEYGDTKGRFHLHAVFAFQKSSPENMELLEDIEVTKFKPRSVRRGFHSPLLAKFWTQGLVHIGDSYAANTVLYISEYLHKCKHLCYQSWTPGFGSPQSLCKSAEVDHDEIDRLIVQVNEWAQHALVDRQVSPLVYTSDCENPFYFDINFKLVKLFLDRWLYDEICLIMQNENTLRNEYRRQKQRLGVALLQKRLCESWKIEKDSLLLQHWSSDLDVCDANLISDDDYKCEEYSFTEYLRPNDDLYRLLLKIKKSGHNDLFT